MRRLVAVVVAFVLVGLMPPAAGNTFIDEQYIYSAPPVQGQLGWISGYYDDGVDDLRGTSVLWGVDRGDGTGDFADVEICSSMEDPNCEKFSSFEFLLYLPPCTTEITTDCIAGVTALIETATQQADFIRQFPERGSTDFTGNEDVGLPDGKSPSLWRFPELTHMGGRDFFVVAALTGFVNDGKLDQPQLRMSLYPVSVVSADNTRNTGWHVALLPNGKEGKGGNNDNRYSFLGNNEGLKRWPFPENVRFQMTIRTGQKLVGWLHGRVQEPTIELKTGDFGQEFTVTAAPTVVPVLDHWSRFTDLPQPLQDVLRKERPSGAFFGGTSQDGEWEKINTSYQNGGITSEDTMQKFLYFVDIAGDKAAANKSSWTVRTITSQEMGNASSCLQSTNSLAGVVATNSTVYLAGPPRFDQVSQTLNYRVAAPHYARDGKVNIGHYSLVMRSEVARCVYGFRDAPISASISVISADGAQQVATTVVSQKDGWLNLMAGGFTYSSPTVQVKLTQEAPAVVPPVVQPPASVKPAKVKKTITCVKGGKVKKVRAVKPTCPAGWKKR